MLPSNNILVFIAALVISAQTSSPNIGRGSFVYDPNSITQNEKFLRLILRLASHTANRLIHLKNEVKLKKASTTPVDTIVPQVRIELPDNHSGQRINGGKPYGHYERFKYPYGQYSPRGHFGDEARGPYNTAYYDRSGSSGPYAPAPNDELIERQKYGRHSGRYIPDRRDNDKYPVEARKSSNNPSLKDSIMLPQVSDKSFDANVPSIKSQEKSKKSLQDIGFEDSNKIPVEIESRMLFNVEKNNYVTHDNDYSRNINNADSKINKVASPNQQGTSIPQLGSVVVNQSAHSSEFNGHKETSDINKANVNVNNVDPESSGSVVTQNSDSMIFSQNFNVSTERIESDGSNVQSRSSESTQGTKSNDSHLQSGSSEVESAAQGIKSVINNPGESGIVHQATSAASSLQSGSSGMIDTAQGLASGVKSGTADAGISRQIETAASKLHSTTGMTSSAQGVVPEAQSADAGAEMSSQALAKVSDVQSGITEQLSAVQHAGSKVLTETVATVNENQANQTMMTPVDNQRNESSGKHGLFDMLARNKSGEIFSNANPGTNTLLNQGSPLDNSNQELISNITNIGSGTTGKVMQAAENTDSKGVQGIEKPVASMVHDSTGKVGKLLEDLTERGSSSKSLLQSGDDDQVSQVGSRLISSVPLFRSFPDVNDESSTLKNSLLDIIHSKNNSIELIDSQISLNQQNADNHEIVTRENDKKTSTKGRLSIFYDEYGNNEDISEDRVLELDLEEYANQFADALRPVESIRGQLR